MKAVHQDLIRQRAYEIWEQSGRPDGLDREHWAEAERQLLDAAPEIAAPDPVIPETGRSVPTRPLPTRTYLWLPPPGNQGHAANRPERVSDRLCNGFPPWR